MLLDQAYSHRRANGRALILRIQSARTDLLECRDEPAHLNPSPNSLQLRVLGFGFLQGGEVMGMVGEDGRTEAGEHEGAGDTDNPVDERNRDLLPASSNRTAPDEPRGFCDCAAMASSPIPKTCPVATGVCLRFARRRFSGALLERPED